MKVKKKISALEFDNLDESIKVLYVADGDNYKLDIDGDEDTGALKRAKDRESQLRRDAEAKLREATQRLEDLESSDAQNSGDVKLLTKSYESKIEKLKGDYDAKVNKLTKSLTNNLVDNTASAIAAKISKAPKLLIPHIKARLQADLDGDTPATKVLDAEGNVSASTLADLEAEFIANPDFSAIIIASQSSGGAGKKGVNNPGGTHQKPNTETEKPDINAMSNAEFSAYLKAQKESASEQE